MEEIAASSNEQATGIDELNRAIAQIDNTTQQNAATVEELASTSDSLSNEAMTLAASVSRFTVSNEKQRTTIAQPAAVRPASPASPPPALKKPRSMPAPATKDTDFSKEPALEEGYEEF
jgi:methyl-accepting chemotaxis protein